MNLCWLPTEIIQHIVKELDGRSLARCRAVCKRLKEEVDCLNDDIWRKFCETEHWYYKKHHENHSSWYEMYKSLNLLTNIKKAAINPKMLEIGEHRICAFKIMKDEIAVLVNEGVGSPSRDSLSTFNGLYNTIIYYDLQTLLLLRIQPFNFLFKEYNENDELITGVRDDGVLFAYSKSHDSFTFITEFDRNEADIVYSLLNDKIYFQDSNYIVYLSALQENGQMKTVVLKEFYKKVLGFSYMQSLYVLTECGGVFIYNDDDFQKIDDYKEPVKDIRTYGFNDFLPVSIPSIVKEFGRLFLDVARGEIEIYVKNENKQYDKPEKVVKLGVLMEEMNLTKKRYKYFAQIIQQDIFVSEKGHQIIVLSGYSRIGISIFLLSIRY